MKRALVVTAAALFALTAAGQDFPSGRFTKISGMLLPGMITREANGIPHLFAFNKHDLYFMNGWVQANDRLWQMDTNRRIASGTLAELVGSSALSTDVQLRTLGLRRAAEASFPLLTPEAQDALKAYSDGVNAWLSTHAASQPPEYSLLEITKIAPWTPVDSVAVAKLVTFGLSFDLGDIDRTIALLTYQAVGKAAGFDGTKLFFDVFRVAPFTSAAVIPDATGAGAALPVTIAPNAHVIDTTWIHPQMLDLLHAYREQIARVDVLAQTLDPDRHAASNEWAIAPKNSASGRALVANDPHLSLQSPPNFYPISLTAGKTSVNGMGFVGAPFVAQGQNQRAAWGSTVHPMDVTDVYQEQLVPDASSPSGFSTLYKGKPEQVIPIPAVFRVNVAGDGKLDNLVTVSDASVPPAVLIVPRHGPIVQLDTKTGVAVSVQYVGFYPTHELDAVMKIDDAQNVDDFKAALQYFDVGSQNWAVADIDGDIAYLTSGEMPVREDLQALKVNGVPPFFIRNGQGGNEWMAVTNPQPKQALPFEILPYSEMPQIVNPLNGWFVNANNDPIGQTLDNDPLNTLRPGGGLLYLSPGYDGFRAGRITQLVRQKLANGGKISVDDMKSIQADTVLIDAEVFVSFIVKAMVNAATSSPQLGALRGDATLNAAVDRLSKWNFTTPTGIPTGYDAAETNGQLTTPTQAEIDNSVAATIYSVWRSEFLAHTVDATLAKASLMVPPAEQALSLLRFQLEHFDETGGKGSAGLSFFNVPASGAGPAATQRDILILQSLADALTRLKSDAFAPAFAKSTNLDDYRWGKLHRVIFSHLLGPLFSPGDITGPPPFPSVPGLRGIATDGGFSTVDAASHNPRGSGVNDFMFTSGPNRRYVGEMAESGPNGVSSLPGGVSGDSRSPFFTNLLLQWLTNDTFDVKTDAAPRIPLLR
jgi:penicillin amidase